MKVLLVAAAALVATSLAATPTEKPLAKRLSHIVETFSHNFQPNSDVDLKLLGDKDDGKSSTKSKRSTATEIARRSHPKSLFLNLGTKGFKNSKDLTADLDSLLEQITSHTSNINVTIARTKANKSSRAKALTDSRTEIFQIRSAISGFLTRLAASRNLNFSDSQLEKIIDTLDGMIQEILGTVDEILGGLGSRSDVTASLNPLMNMVTQLVSRLGVADTDLSTQLRELLASIFNKQVSGERGGLNALMMGLENGLLRLHGVLGSANKSS
ncbi:hypothetical protein FGRMN_2501 [Fusarium graminum]|nr:hypothetical protein FGRMN_2501 [Fusarium graminum]